MHTTYHGIMLDFAGCTELYLHFIPALLHRQIFFQFYGQTCGNN